MQIQTRHVLAGLALAVVVQGCARTLPSDRRSSPTPPMSETLSLSSYIEEGALVALAAGVRPTKTRSESECIPIEVAVANKSVPSMVLTLESFVLIDELGTRYHPLPSSSLDDCQVSVDFDRRLGELEAIYRAKFGTYAFVPNALTPSFNRPALNSVSVPRTAYVVDMLYFPRPESGVRGHVFELFLHSRHLVDPVFVTFRVPGKDKSTTTGSAR